jgi:hypothetical protein
LTLTFVGSRPFSDFSSVMTLEMSLAAGILRVPLVENLRLQTPLPYLAKPYRVARVLSATISILSSNGPTTAHASSSEIYAGKETKANSMKPWLASLLFATSLLGQPPKVRLPDEVAGVDGIARTLISAFDQVDIVALGDWHGRKLDSDLRIAVVRHPDFAKKVRSIVVEFGSTSEQSTLDRYIRGENISRAQLEQVWKTTTQAGNGVWDSPVYAEFFAAVRDVNSKLPADARVRVFGGDPGPGDNRSRETAAVSVLKEQVFQKHGKALVIYGAAHFYRTMPRDYLSSVGQDIGIVRMLEIDYPGRTLVVIPIGRLDIPPGALIDNSHPPPHRVFWRVAPARATGADLTS